MASLLLLLLGLAGPASAATAAAEAQAVLLRDDRGREHRFETPPQRIVSLLPSLTESLWALGAGPQLVGLDRWSNWPAALDKLPRLGGMDDMSIEAVATLRPDVVVASTSARGLDRLDALGFRVLRLKSDNHADVQRSLLLLAQMLGRPAEGPRLWAQLQAQLQAAATHVPPAWRGATVYFELGGGPYAAGRSSFIGETLAALGLHNIVEASLGAFPQLSPEFVVRAQPQLLVGLQREQALMAQRPGWAALKALRQGQRCALSSSDYELLTRPGPRLGQAAQLLADCLARLPAPAP